MQVRQDDPICCSQISTEIQAQTDGKKSPLVTGPNSPSRAPPMNSLHSLHAPPQISAPKLHAARLTVPVSPVTSSRACLQLTFFGHPLHRSSTLTVVRITPSCPRGHFRCIICADTHIWMKIISVWPQRWAYAW
jgi:hypothetical protein